MQILKNSVGLAAVFLTAFCPSAARATKTVTSPYVTEGRLTAEWRGGYEEFDDGDDDTFRTRNQIAYGFTDHYELKISGDSRNRGEMEWTDVDIENKFQVAPRGEWPVDVGIRIDYTAGLRDNADGIGGKILLGRVTGPVSHLLNLEAGREVGGDSSSNEWGTGLSYAGSVSIDERFSVGLEWYSDFGDFEGGFSEQDHRAGPVLYGNLFNRVRFQAGALKGLSREAPDMTYKATVNYSYEF